MKLKFKGSLGSKNIKMKGKRQDEEKGIRLGHISKIDDDVKETSHNDKKNGKILVRLKNKPDEPVMVEKPLPEEIEEEIIVDDTSTENKKFKIRFRPEETVGGEIPVSKNEDDNIRMGYLPFSYPMQTQRAQLPADNTIKEINTHVKINGIRIPEVEFAKEELVPTETKNKRLINMKYPLIPENPKKGERVFAYAHIFFDNKLNELVYNIIEPEINDRINKKINEIKSYIHDKIDIDFSEIKKTEAVGYVDKIIKRGMGYFKVTDKNDMKIIRYYILRDFIGLEKIEPLIKDKFIEDISCDGNGIPIYIYHRDVNIGSVRTNIVFNNKNILDSFVNKLAERCGKTISVANPLLDGTLPDGSRIQATLGSDIARHGSNFTIRMFTENPLVTTDMIRFGTCDLKLMAYLWILIENGMNILISGGTAVGKTSFLNVLSLFIRPEMKIISIEDTGELKLPHSHWISEVARTPIAEKGKVDLFMLLKESLRQRPDYIIVGEVRGKEAYILFQQMAVGHPGLSTMHSENFSKLMNRLTSPPISLSPNLVENLDCVLFLNRMKKGEKYLRRVGSVIEIVGYDEKNDIPLSNEVIKWDMKSDSFKVLDDSFLLKKASEKMGLDENETKEEIKNRAKVIEWMARNNITNYIKVGKIMTMYYTSKDYLMAKIEGNV